MTKEELLEKLEEAAKPGSDLEDTKGWLRKVLVLEPERNPIISRAVGLVAADAYCDLESWYLSWNQIRERLHEYAHRLRNI